MTDEPMVDCPRCLGGGHLSAGRIAQLQKTGAWSPGVCQYCGGGGRVPAVVAELVPPQDFDAWPDRKPFAGPDEFLAELGRLAACPYCHCRDDAWAALGYLLTRSIFPRGDLPWRLWEQARPFLHGNSLGKLAAAEVGLGLFSVPQALDIVFSRDHPRAPDLSPGWNYDNSPYYLARCHPLWLDPERAAEAARLVPGRLKEIADPGWRSSALVEFLKPLAALAPARVVEAEGAWLQALADLPRAGNNNDYPRNNAAWTIFLEVLPHLPAADAGRWLPRLLDECLEAGNWNYYVAMAALKFAGKHWAEEQVEGLLGGIVERARATLPRENWARAYSYLTSGLVECTRVGPGAWRKAIAAVAATGEGDAWYVLDDQSGFLANGEFVARGLAGQGAHPWSWDVFQELVGHVEGVPVPAAAARGLAAVARGLREASSPWLGPALRLLLDRAAGLAPTDQRDRLLEAVAPAAARLSPEAARDLARLLPRCLPPPVEPYVRSCTLARFVESLAPACPEVLREKEDDWLAAIAELPWTFTSGFPRSNAVYMIAWNALARLPETDGERLAGRLLEVVPAPPDWHDFAADMALLRFAAEHRSEDAVGEWLSRLLARVRAFPAAADRPRALTYLCAIPGGTRHGRPCHLRTLCAAVAATGVDDAWCQPDNEPPGFSSNAELLARGLARCGGQEGAWEVFEELVGYLDAVPVPEQRAHGLACAAKGLREDRPPWWGRAVRRLLERVAARSEPARRGRVLEEMAPALLGSPLLGEFEDLWFALLPDVDVRRGDAFPRQDLTANLAQQALPRFAPADAARWIGRALDATAGCADWREFSGGDSALLVAAARLPAEAESVRPLLDKMLARVRALPDRQDWAVALSYLPGPLGGRPAATLEAFRTLAEAVAGTGLDNAWCLPRDEDRLNPNAQVMANAVAGCGQREWSWDAFRMLVEAVDAAKAQANRAGGLACVGRGLGSWDPPWRAQALELLLDRCDTLSDGTHRGTALEGVAGALVARWQAPSFEAILERLPEVGVGARTSRFAGLAGWLKKLSEPVLVQPAYRPVFARAFDRVLAAVGRVPAAEQWEAGRGLVECLSPFADHETAHACLVRLFDLVDRQPPGDYFRAGLMRAMLDAVGWDYSFPSTDNRCFVQVESLARLRDLEPGGNKLHCLHQVGWNLIQSPAGLCNVLDALAQVADLSVPQAPPGGSPRDVIAHLAGELGKHPAPLPDLPPARFDAWLAAIRRLPNQEVTWMSEYRGVPRVTCQAALLRRFAALGDDPWRDAVLDGTLEHAREYADPEHRRALVLALLEGLGAVPLRPWHKTALHRLAAFAAREEGMDLSVLRRGIVGRLVQLGDLADAAQQAREVVNPQLRSEALAEVARALAGSAPAAAVELLDEVVSPEVRGRLAVELAEVAPLTGDARRVWALLRAAADDPDVLQRAVGRLLGQADSAEVRRFLAQLGWDRPAVPASSGPLEAVLDDLQSAELITARKRERVLSRLAGPAGTELHAALYRAALEFLVASDQVAEEDAAELLGRDGKPARGA